MSMPSSSARSLFTPASKSARRLPFVMLSLCVAAAACTPAADDNSGTTTGGRTGTGAGGRTGSGGSSSTGSGGSSSTTTGGSSGTTTGGSTGTSTGGSTGSGGSSSTGSGGSAGSTAGSGGSRPGGSGGSSSDAAAGETAPPSNGMFPPGPHKVVLITGDDRNMADPSRVQMLEILNSMKASHGIQVEEIPAATARSAALMDRALIIAGPNAPYFGTTPDPGFKSLPVPLIVSKDGNTGAFGIGSPGASDPPTDNKVVLVKTDHPLAAGLSAGTISVLSTPDRQRIVFWTGLGAGAIKIAASARGAASNQWTIVGYEKGSDLPGGLKAPAKRVGFFWHRPAGPSPEGRKLFQAAVEWAITP